MAPVRQRLRTLGVSWNGPVLFSRIRDLTALVKKWLRVQPRGDEFAPQRICPFCGLITARSKRYCLECGKSFKPA
jgi:hypothetical protein